MSNINININGDLFTEDFFNINIMKCGQENCNKNKAPEGGVRPYNTIHFITHGRGYFFIGNKEYKLKKGQCFLMFDGGAKGDYCYYPDKSEPWSYIWIDFRCDKARELFAKCGVDPCTSFFTVKSWDFIHTQLLNIIDSYNSSKTQNLYISGYFLLLLSMLIDDYTKLQNHYSGKNPQKFRYVRDAIIFMNNNYRIKFDLNEVAENIGISPTHLTAAFADEMGFSPMYYLTLFRIANACELLRQEKFNISEVSNQTGFSDPLYFSRCFSKVKGMSPRQYIQSKTEEDPFEFFKERHIDF